MTTIERIITLLQNGKELDDDEIAKLLRVDRHYVNSLSRQLVDSGRLQRRVGTSGKLVNRLINNEPSEGRPDFTESDRAIEAAKPAAVDEASFSQTLKAARDFESHARRLLSSRWNVALEPRLVRLTSAAEPKIKFDLVSADQAIVGDAKYLKNIRVPAAKWSVIAEYVWLLQHVTRATKRFMVFGQDREVADRWLARFRPVTEGVEFYFLHGEDLIQL